MSSKQIIVKFDELSVSEKYPLLSLKGTFDVKSIINFIGIASLDANPREAKSGSTVDDIIETIAKTPELYPHKSKGILISCKVCEALERNRYKLVFDDPDIEGVLDGGHNMLAIGMFILKHYIIDEKELNQIKNWEDFQRIWQNNIKTINEMRDEIAYDHEFFTPVEILSPKGLSPDEVDAFIEPILDIAQARNNNVQLTEETIANKAGYYDQLKEMLDPSICQDVEWKSNQGGRIKSRNLVAFTLIPLYRAMSEIKGMPSFSPTIIYSSKGKCVEIFNKVVKSNDIARDIDGGVRREITNKNILSALELMKDIPKLFDDIYLKFPMAFNSSPSGERRSFGRIKSVQANNAKENSSKNPHKTYFYKKLSKYKFDNGYIYPIIWALNVLIIKKEDGTYDWVTDPYIFIEKCLANIIDVYASSMKTTNYDPQKIAKDITNYRLLEKMIDLELRDYIK